MSDKCLCHFPWGFVNEFEKIIDEAVAANKEMAVSVCRLPDGELTKTAVKVGTKTGVRIPECPDGALPETTFHVHPIDSTLEITGADYANTFDFGFGSHCVGQARMVDGRKHYAIVCEAIDDDGADRRGITKVEADEMAQAWRDASDTIRALNEGKAGTPEAAALWLRYESLMARADAISRKYSVVQRCDPPASFLMWLRQSPEAPGA